MSLIVIVITQDPAFVSTDVQPKFPLPLQHNLKSR